MSYDSCGNQIPDDVVESPIEQFKKAVDRVSALKRPLTLATPGISVYVSDGGCEITISCNCTHVVMTQHQAIILTNHLTKILGL